MPNLMQPLESRRLLAVAVTWVNDNWVVSNDLGSVGLSFGDTVENTGSGDGGFVTSKTFGVEAFAKIADAINNTKSDGTIHILNGTYKESDITIVRPVTIAGDNRDTVSIIPASPSSHSGSIFSLGVHSAFIIQSARVTIRDLTIDGDIATQNYRGGIIYDYRSGQAFNNITVSNTAIKNIFDLGIYLDGGIGALSTGHVISNNIITDVTGGPQGTAILLLQASASVTGNSLTNSSFGISTNYVDGENYAPKVTIQGNTLADNPIAMNLSGLAAGSLVGGPAAGQGNTITLPGDDGIGIIVDYSVGQVTIEKNSIAASATDSAIWLFHNDAAHPVIVKNNTLTATAAMSNDLSESAGIFITTDGSLFSDQDAPSFANIVGNDISGFVAGIVADGGTVSISGTLAGAPILAAQQSAKVQILNSEVLSSLAISTQSRIILPAAGNNVLRISDLSISPDSFLDLGDNDLILQSNAAARASTLAAVLASIKSARNTVPLPWQGPGLTSSGAAANASAITGLAALLNDQGNGTPIYAQFDGQSVDANSILIKYTYNGDADLNGKVDADDYFLIDSGFAKGLSQNRYRNGDFDFSGAVDADDYFLIDRAFVSQTAALAVPSRATASRKRHRHHPWKENLLAI